MSRCPSQLLGILAVCAGLLVVAARPANAQSVSVTGSFAPVTGGFVYSLFVTYLNPINPTDALGSVLITTPADPAAATALLAPLGFDISFDPGLGSLALTEDFNGATPQRFLAGTTQGAFQFRSNTNLNGAPFEALGDAGLFTGTVNLQVAPEPGAFALLVPGLLVGAALRLVRRR